MDPTTDELRQYIAARASGLAQEIDRIEADAKQLPSKRLELDVLKKSLAAFSGIQKPRKARAKRGAPERFVDALDRELERRAKTQNESLDIDPFFEWMLTQPTFEGGPTPSRSAVLKVIRKRDHDATLLAGMPAE